MAPVAVGLDGESLVLAPPLRFVSCRAPSASACRGTHMVFPAAAAVPLTRRNLWALARIAPEARPCRRRGAVG